MVAKSREQGAVSHGGERRGWLPARGPSGWLRLLCAGSALLVVAVTAAQAQTPQQRAREAAAEAERAVVRADATVNTLERGFSVEPDRLTAAWRERSNLVLEWRRAADAWLAADPASPDATRSVTSSERAMDEYYVPGGAPEEGNAP